MTQPAVLNRPFELIEETRDDGLLDSLIRQRQAYLAEGPPSYRQRREDLKKLSQLIQDHQEAIVDAICRDYGNRSRHETLMCEVMTTLEGIKHSLKHLKGWMRPQRRSINRTLYPGARNQVIPQPLGVVGIIVPWNFPLNLSLSPLANIFAAGNRAMVKMSKNSSHLAALLKQVSQDYFPPEKLAFFEGSGGVGSQFSQLPFDYLLFTGSGQTGRAVMAAAAPNLTPVTLELGGKSPAILAPDFPLKTAVERMLFVKLLNAGQICTTVDYAFVPQDRIEDFVAEARTCAAQRYPDINGPDYTSIIDDKSWERLDATLKDAESKGATLINLAPDQVPDRALRKFPPHVLLNVNDTMTVMQEEIFGPILPILGYQDSREVVDYINGRDRPLALYPFTRNGKLRDFYIDRIQSGGVSVNDALFHVGQHDLPFGGVGASGMGHYHGYEGFLTFSKLRPVFHQARFSTIKLLAPPYGKFATLMLDHLVRMVR